MKPGKLYIHQDNSGKISLYLYQNKDILWFLNLYTSIKSSQIAPCLYALRKNAI